MNNILADRQLRDLIEVCEDAYRALDSTFHDELTRDDFRDLAEEALGALGKAIDYLDRLRD